MKPILILSTLLLWSSICSAELTGESSSSVNVGDLNKNPSPRWNLNLGLGRFQTESSQQALTVELQRKIWSDLYMGISYANHSLWRDSFISQYDISTASIEGRFIRVQLNDFEVFGAVNGGVLASSFSNSPSDAAFSAVFFYGAGLGINYKNQVGLRADMKSSRDFPTITGFSLVGYY